METPTTPEATPPEKEIHKEDETYECKTLEEYNEKSALYKETIQINALNQREIYESSLVFLASKMEPSRVRTLDNMLASKKIYRCEGMRKSRFDLPKSTSERLRKEVQLGILKKVDTLQHTFMFLPTQFDDAFPPGSLIVSSGKGLAEFPIMSVASGQKNNLYPKNVIEKGYVNTKIFLAYMHEYNLTKHMTYDLPPRPLPPSSLDAKTQASLKTRLATDLLKAELADPQIFSLARVYQATKSVLTTLDGKEKEFMIGDEKVDRPSFKLYEKYKKDWMIPQGETNQLQAKPGTPQNYQNLSRSYFKNNILNKDPTYTTGK